MAKALSVCGSSFRLRVLVGRRNAGTGAVTCPRAAASTTANGPGSAADIAARRIARRTAGREVIGGITAAQNGFGRHPQMRRGLAAAAAANAGAAWVAALAVAAGVGAAYVATVVLARWTADCAIRGLACRTAGFAVRGDLPRRTTASTNTKVIRGTASAVAADASAGGAANHVSCHFICDAPLPRRTANMVAGYRISRRTADSVGGAIVAGTRLRRTT